MRRQRQGLSKHLAKIMCTDTGKSSFLEEIRGNNKRVSLYR